MSMSGMCEKCRIGIGRENRNKVRVETTGIPLVWDQVIEKRSAGCALAQRRNMSQATALGAGMCQGTFFLMS